MLEQAQLEVRTTIKRLSAALKESEHLRREREEVKEDGLGRGAVKFEGEEEETIDSEGDAGLSYVMGFGKHRGKALSEVPPQVSAEKLKLARERARERRVSRREGNDEKEEKQSAT